MRNRSRWVRPAAFALLCGLVAAIFILSSQPYRVQTIQPFLQRTLSPEKAERMLPHLDIRYDGKPYRRDVNPFGFIELLVRKGAHLLVYASLAAAAALALGTFRLRAPAAAALSLLAVLLVAGLDEWNQRFAPGRTPAAADVAVDLAGGALGLALFFASLRLYRLRKKRPVSATPR